MEIDAVMIYSFEDYRSWLSAVYTFRWIDSSEEEIYKVFGKPRQYPFAFYTKLDESEDSRGGVDFVKIYLEGLK